MIIRPLTKDEFINIATNGIEINLYDSCPNEYIQSLIDFIEKTRHDYCISDFDNTWCDISMYEENILTVSFENNKVVFSMGKDVTIDNKKYTGIAIKIVYMHTVAWEAINNNGKVNQPFESWPI